MSCNEIYNKTKDLIVDYLRVDESEITAQTNLVDDLCADSIALVELGFRISETFSVPMVDANPEMFTMKNLVQYIEDKISG